MFTKYAKVYTNGRIKIDNILINKVMTFIYEKCFYELIGI